MNLVSQPHKRFKQRIHLLHVPFQKKVEKPGQEINLQACGYFNGLWTQYALRIAKEMYPRIT